MSPAPAVLPVRSAPGGIMRSVITGVLLAAGAGTRMGRPKALVHSVAGEPWLTRSVRVLREGGCDEVVVVLGAEADRARALLPADTTVVVAPDWAAGQSASLRAGLSALDPDEVPAALVHLVDLPDVGPEVVRRVLEHAHQLPALPTRLARATYAGRPGHPVLLGSAHWPSLLTELDGDRGARDHLARHQVHLVECGDLASGADVDRA